MISLDSHLYAPIKQEAPPSFKDELSRLIWFCKEIHSRTDTSTTSIFDEIISVEMRRKAGRWEGFESSIKSRKLMKLALTDMMQHLLSKEYSISNATVLEIGSGHLSPKAQSHLSSIFPRFKKWNFSDLDYVAALYQKKVRYYELDIANKRKKSPIGGFNYIAGSNCLDCLSYKHLDAAFSNIKKMLDRKGFFVHVADMPFLYESFIDACSNEKGIILPSNDSEKRLYSIPNDQYKKILKKADQLLSEEEREFFKLWGGHDSQTQSWSIQNTVIGSRHFEDFNAHSWKYLTNKVEQLFPSEKRKVLERSTLIEEYLQAAAHKNGLTVFECGYRSHHFCTELPPADKACEGENYFICSRAFQTALKIYVLAPNKRMYVNELHVFIAGHPHPQEPLRQK